MSTIVSKVYLVDAAVEVRRRLACLLGAIAGVEVAGEAQDGDAALDGIVACDADIVVLDLRLGGGTSLDLIRALTRTHPAIVKIVLTNHTARALRAACEAAGADFFFDKTSEFDAACHTVAGIARARGARARE